MIQIKRYINKSFSSNSYFLWQIGEKECIIVDCGDNHQLIEDLVVRELKPTAVFLSHTHYDHINGLNDLISVFPLVKIFTNDFGYRALLSNKLNLSKYNSDSFELKNCSNVHIIDSNCDTVYISKFDVKVIHAPGHNPSCLAFLIDKYLFTGDSFIPGLKVVTNLPYVDKSMALENYQKLNNLSKNFIICPGHGNIFYGS